MHMNLSWAYQPKGRASFLSYCCLVDCFWRDVVLFGKCCLMWRVFPHVPVICSSPRNPMPFQKTWDTFSERGWMNGRVRSCTRKDCILAVVTLTGE